MIAAGQRVFGENRVQEAEKRWHRRQDIDDLELRMIGPLQTNKAAQAISLFNVIESVDREKLAKAIAAAAEKVGKQAPAILIQVNTGEEPQKSGVVPSDLESLIRYSQNEARLTVRGLMCIPPANEPAGPHFALLAKLAERFQLPELSMGMSSDFETAIKFGATHVRIGSALFGKRTQQG